MSFIKKKIFQLSVAVMLLGGLASEVKCDITSTTFRVITPIGKVVGMVTAAVLSDYSASALSRAVEEYFDYSNKKAKAVKYIARSIIYLATTIGVLVITFKN